MNAVQEVVGSDLLRKASHHSDICLERDIQHCINLGEEGGGGYSDIQHCINLGEEGGYSDIQHCINLGEEGGGGYSDIQHCINLGEEGGGGGGGGGGHSDIQHCINRKRGRERLYAACPGPISNWAVSDHPRHLQGPTFL